MHEYYAASKDKFKKGTLISDGIYTDADTGRIPDLVEVLEGLDAQAIKRGYGA